MHIDFIKARAAYLNGEDCDDLYYLMDEIDIEIAELGVDRDRSEVEIDEYRDKRMFELLDIK